MAPDTGLRAVAVFGSNRRIEVVGFCLFPDKTARIFSQIVSAVGMGAAAATAANRFVLTFAAKAFEFFLTLPQIFK